MNLKITTEDGDVIYTPKVEGNGEYLEFKSTDGLLYNIEPHFIKLIEVEPFY